MKRFHIIYWLLAAIWLAPQVHAQTWLPDLAGTWVLEMDSQGEEAADFRVEIREDWITHETIRLVVSDYCDGYQADFLYFDFDQVDQSMSYAYATLDGYQFDMPQLADMRLSWAEVEGETVLRYEVEEIDASYLADLQLKRLHNPHGWACHLQEDLTDLLASGQFQLLGRDRQLLSLEEAFGTDMVAEELTFFAQHQSLIPMYEEWCVSTPFDIVVIGGLYPNSPMQVYGIEWELNEIRLFETSIAPESEGLHLMREGLRYVVVPLHRVQ